MIKQFKLYFLFPFSALILAVIAFSSQLFNIAPLGKTLNPFIGVIQNQNDQKYLNSSLILRDSTLLDSVNVFFDERKVPHIYAKNSSDMYFTQGYVSAYLRLWQMDFLTYAAAGRLSEIFDKSEFLDYDRNQRRIGILKAAQESLRLIENNPETNAVLTAYSQGVNAYIRQLTYKHLPFEYKLLDYQPEPWSKLKTVLILKQLGNTLSGYDEDAYLSKMIIALGNDNFHKLFPEYVNEVSPIVPSDNSSDTASKILKPAYLDFNFLYSNSVLSKSSYNSKLGSNSWAVAGKKTKSGFPILCTDPHLGFALPSIWLEMQLNCPNTNVYGVSIPGTPAIIMGFNDAIAWGTTNGADDVKDWYKLRISNDYKQYKFDGKWLKLESRVDVIKRRNRKPFLDTIYSTIHGPIVTTKNFPKSTEYMNYAMRWQLHSPSNEFATFIKLSRSKNYNDFQEAVKSYSSPIQNFTFASKDGDIAIFHQGNMSVKRKGQGKFIMDGTISSDLLTKNISFDSLPKIHNPPSGYVFSANQHPTSSAYPFYYNGYFSESRANRINALLKAGTDFDIPKMQNIQLDNVSDIALRAMPVLEKLIDPRRLNNSQLKRLSIVKNWNGAYNRNDENALFFDLWWKRIMEYSFDELNSYYFNIRLPDDYVLLDLLKSNPNEKVFDKIETPEKETATDIITQSFINANKEYAQKLSSGMGKWGDVNKINFFHMTNLPALSRLQLPSSGNPNAINATSSSWGPSWRMIVALGKTPQAFGIYPGGQSGDPGSRNYQDFIAPWNEGKYFKLNFYTSAAEARKSISNQWTFLKR